jgi:hypothetical protein
LSAAARSQESDWNRKDAGLVGSAKVEGRWPVKPWNIALKERKLSIAAELAELIADKLTTDKKYLDAVADAVANNDIVPNWLDTAPVNPTMRVKSALAEIGKATKPAV